MSMRSREREKQQQLQQAVLEGIRQSYVFHMSRFFRSICQDRKTYSSHFPSPLPPTESNLIYGFGPTSKSVRRIVSNLLYFGHRSG